MLTNCKPRHMLLNFSTHFPLQVPFATLQYHEENCIARLEVTMHNEPISDDTFEYVLSRLKGLIQNLAQRPEMILFIRSDARDSALPATRHIKRFLSFVQDNGSEFVLVGRGTAIVLRSRGLIGSSLAAVVRFVQRFFPSPWPETTVSTMEEAEEFLSGLAADARAEFAAQAALELEENEKSDTRTQQQATLELEENEKSDTCAQQQVALESRDPFVVELVDAGVLHVSNVEHPRAEEEEIPVAVSREDTVQSMPPTRWASPDVEAVPRSPAWLSREEAEEDKDASEPQRLQVEHEDYIAETPRAMQDHNVTVETPAVTSWAGAWSPWLCGVNCVPCGWSAATRHSTSTHNGVSAHGPSVQRALEPAQAASSRGPRPGAFKAA